MIKLLFFLFLFSVFLPASSVDEFNNLIKSNNFNFTHSQDTNGQFMFQSEGFIKNNNKEVLIETIKPFRELYTIKDSIVEIYDYELDQKNIYEINDLESNQIIKILSSGIKPNQINGTIEISKNNDLSRFELILNSGKVLIEFNNLMASFQYYDSLNIKNLITLSKV